MAGLHPRGLKCRAVYQRNQEVDIEPRRLLISEQADVSGCRQRRQGGNRKLPGQRHRTPGLQQHGEDKDRDHSGNDYSHSEISLKTECVPGRLCSRPAVSIDKSLVHHLAGLEAGYGGGSVTAEN